MNILVIGSGGREHALCWKLRQSKLTDKLYCAPGNAGIAAVAECIDIGATEAEKLAEFAQSHDVAFAVVGPEAPLCAGVGDRLRAAGLRVFGPDAEGARLEGSKDFAKRFMRKYDIPTARSATFTDAAAARQYIAAEFAHGAQGIVVKADGLAAGKGVLVAATEREACEFVDGCFGGAFGASGETVLIEERLVGEEASILALTDGKVIVPLVTSQDHKRVFDGDKGPNTGGMGAYSPAPVVSDAVMRRIKADILDRFLAGIRAEKIAYRGVIFVGIMVAEGRAKVLEFNVRFGDPEIQAVVRRFDGDWADALYKTADGRLAEADLVWSDEPAVSVVIAAGAYPGHCRKGDEITGLDDAAQTGAVVFHAGTAFKDGKIVSAGGRVLGVSARGKTIREAIANAYRGVDKIHFKDCFCRRDIGAKALKYGVMEKRPGMLSTAEKEVHVIPEPAYLRWASKEYIDLSDYRLADTPETAPFADDLRRLFGLTGSGTGRLLCGKLAGAESPEAYTISVRSGEVRIAAASRRGMRYAVETLKQLRAGTWLREMDLEDAPAMAVRGFHTNLTNMRQLDFPAVLKLIDTFAKFKINTWLLEYNHTFPFAGHPVLHGALTFSPEEVAEIERRCQALDIEIMPLMQCLGHNGHIGLHPEYRHLFEPEDGGDAADMQFCPLNPDAFKLFQDLAGQIMAAHPGGKYFHIAADEARRLGKCPKCAAFVREHGAGRLYTDCINRACSWVREQGRVPVIWDDMLSHYPDLVPQIDRGAAIMYWDYWTTSDPTPFFIARPTAMPQTADAYWQDHFAELDEPERTITRLYGEFTDVAKLLETPNMQPIRKYLGTRTPRWFDAFPYFDFYRDLGFQVFAAPSALGNTIDDLYGLPNLGRTCKNIRLFAEKCRKSGGAGLFTTAWYDFPPEILLIGVIETAQNTWCGREMPPTGEPQPLN